MWLIKKGGRSFYGHSQALLIGGGGMIHERAYMPALTLFPRKTYTAKSAAADVAPPNFSPSSNFCTLFKPQAMPLEPCALYG